MKMTQYSYHEYDVEFFGMYNILKSISNIKANKKMEDALFTFNFYLSRFCENNNIVKKDFINQAPSLVISSGDNAFLDFFAWKLAMCDLPKINLVLNYHKKDFRGNYYAEKDDFVGMVEFSVYPLVKKYSFQYTGQRLDRIIQWVENQRINEPAVDTKEENISKKGAANNPLQTESHHPTFNPNLWSRECFDLFMYLYDNYKGAKVRRLTNIWFFLKEHDPQKFRLNCTKGQYKEFIHEHYGISITNFDKALDRYENTEYPTLNDWRIKFEDRLKID